MPGEVVRGRFVVAEDFDLRRGGELGCLKLHWKIGRDVGHGGEPLRAPRVLCGMAVNHAKPLLEGHVSAVCGQSLARELRIGLSGEHVSTCPPASPPARA